MSAASTYVAATWIGEQLRVLVLLASTFLSPLAAIDPDPDAAPPPQCPPSSLRLGVEHSTADTLTWVGFETATEHAAPEGDADQSAMNPDPGQATEVATGDGSSPGQPATPAVATVPDLSAADPPRDPAAIEPAPMVQAATPDVVTAEDLPPADPTLPAPSEPARADQVPQPKTQPPPTPSPVAPTSKDDEGSSGGQGGASGGPVAEKTDEEADAASIRKTAEYKNGKVQAGQGLDIKTVRRPEFSKYTRVTAIPRNPVVEISFDRAGKVKKARILQSSGYKDVDEPILDAVHEWTAKGKELDSLAPSGPGSVLKVIITMRFR